MINASKSQVVRDLSAEHGVIDTHNLSPALEATLAKHGVTKADLAEIAGKDEQIKGAEEMKKLFNLIERLDPRPGDGILTTTGLSAEGRAEPTPAGEVYAALEAEVRRNRWNTRYDQPGTTPAADQPRLTIASNALSVPADEQASAIKLKVKGVDQFSLYPNDEERGAKACFAGATKQADDYNKKAKHKVTLADADQAIQVAVREDRAGRLEVDSHQAALGRDYIDSALERGLPVVVGVSYKDSKYNTDKITDHFVTIFERGHDEQGHLFYGYKDPGAGGGTGRFYVDKDSGRLFKEGAKPDGHWVEDLDYEVSQVRTYRGKDAP